MLNNGDKNYKIIYLATLGYRKSESRFFLSIYLYAVQIVEPFKANVRYK